MTDEGRSVFRDLGMWYADADEASRSELRRDWAAKGVILNENITSDDLFEIASRLEKDAAASPTETDRGPDDL